MRHVDHTIMDSPIFRVRVHPNRSLLAAASVTRDEFYLCGWDSGRLKLVARLGSGCDLTQHGCQLLLSLTFVAPGCDLNGHSATRDYLNWNLFNCIEFHPGGKS